MDPRTQRSIDAYDAAAERYQQAWWRLRPLDAVRKFSGMAGRGAVVIDVAGGPALDVRVLRDAGLRVVSGDRSMEAVRIGGTLFPKKPIACWDFRALPFADGTFAGVWAPAALQHLPRAEMRRALAELRRVHASGPIFLSFREGQEDLAPIDDAPAAPVFATSVTEAELRALLADQGYTAIEVERRPDPAGRAEVTWLYGWGRLA